MGPTDARAPALPLRQAARGLDCFRCWQFIAKLRRLADSLEQGKRFRIQIAGERVTIPPTATINIEHERGSSEEEVEFQLVWSLER